MKTYRLRNGSRVLDPRLDRLPQFDERSLAYRVRKIVKEKKPRSYTWHCHTVLDQGNEGSCVGHGMGHDLLGRPTEVPKIDHKYCREVIYWGAQKIDEWTGGSYPGAKPFYEGTSVLAGAKILKNLGWVDAYYWAQTFNDLVLGVGYNPAVLGVNWYDGMMDVDEKGFIHADGGVAGGHCIWCNGISVKGAYFKLLNSWGPSWGTNGVCKISFDDMEQLLNEDGEACFFTGRHTK